MKDKEKTLMKQQPKFNWTGALKEMSKDYTSVDLQHQISNWRVEDKDKKYSSRKKSDNSKS